MKLVEFEDGTYGVRKRSIFGDKFLNIEAPHLCNRIGDPYFSLSKTTKQKAIKVMQGRNKNLKYKVIDN